MINNYNFLVIKFCALHCRAMQKSQVGSYEMPPIEGDHWFQGIVTKTINGPNGVGDGDCPVGKKWEQRNPVPGPYSKIFRQFGKHKRSPESSEVCALDSKF